MSSVLTQLKPDQRALVQSVVSDLALEGALSKKQLQERLEAELDWRLHPPETALALKKLIDELDILTNDEQLLSVSTMEVIDKFLASKRAANLSEDSVRGYQNTLMPFARTYPNLPATPEEIEEYLVPHRGENATAWSIYIRIRLVYNFAEARGLLPFPNPTRQVQTPKKVAKPPPHLNETEATKLIKAIADDRERGLVYCLFGLGLRLKETRRLTPIDIAEDTIRTVHGKERIEPMPLAPPIREVLLGLAEGKRPDEPIFQGRQGPLSDSQIQNIIKKLFIRAGITGVRPSPHTLRHSKGVLSTMLGLDTYSNRRLMRHASTQMTDRYNELDLEQLKIKDRQHNPLIRILDASELGKKPDYA